MRDIHADYLAAYLTTYESCVYAERMEDASRIADILRDEFGHDVEPSGKDNGLEKTDEKPPENAAAPKPAARRGRPPKAKTAE